jgi:hypothetical protein
MSALAMILTAAMMVPGNGAEPLAMAAMNNPGLGAGALAVQRNTQLPHRSGYSLASLGRSLTKTVDLLLQ